MFPNVNFIQIGGNSGRALEGFDHYSGLMFYGSAPSVTGKWKVSATTPAIKSQQLFSLADAASAGILPNTDNTAAIGSYLITTKGNTGDTIELIVTYPTPNGGTVALSLGKYTALVGSTTIAAQGADIRDVINANTSIHGFTATFATATVTLTAPKEYGISLNTGTPLSATIVGAFAGTVTQFANGTASPYAALYYHLKRYFSRNPNGNVWMGNIAASSSFNELAAFQEVTGNVLRQIGIYDTNETRGSAANITGTITQIQVAVDKISLANQPVVIYSPNIHAVSDLATYPDQNLNVANCVSCVISQDGDSEGANLFLRTGQTIGNIGDRLAATAISRVSSSVAEVTDAQNNSDGVENNVPAFGNGQLSSAVPITLQYQLHQFRYTFFRQFGSTIVGSYWVDNRTCITASSDFCYENDNRVIQKVDRILYATYVPRLSSEVIYNNNGTLKDYVIESFIDDGESAITAGMITGKGNFPEIGGVQITIDNTQNVKATSNLQIVCKTNENAIARNITVSSGYGTF